jgi:hypothetical protein
MNNDAMRPIPPDPLPLPRDETSHTSPLTSPVPIKSPAVAGQHSPPSQMARPKPVTDLKVYSHSTLVYWWPVWVLGYFLAGLSYWQGQKYLIGADSEWYHPSSNLGICFFVSLIIVILITNVSLRGFASGAVILGAAFFTILLAYLGWWDAIFMWLGGLNIHMNRGAYFWFSTLLLIVWTLSVFVFDRMTYWHFRPGQVTREFGFGAGAKSYNTSGMSLEKHREDLFRHWLLGMGSGDLRISTTGATREQIDVPNVMFIGSKIEIIQRLIAEEPDA